MNFRTALKKYAVPTLVVVFGFHVLVAVAAMVFSAVSALPWQTAHAVCLKYAGSAVLMALGPGVIALPFALVWVFYPAVAVVLWAPRRRQLGGQDWGHEFHMYGLVLTPVFWGFLIPYLIVSSGIGR